MLLAGLALLAVAGQFGWPRTAGASLEVERQRGVMFRDVRELLAKLQIARIDAAVRAGRPRRGLAMARDALVAAPDLTSLRMHLSSVLAYDLAPLAADESGRLAWIGEGLRILDEGITRDPGGAWLRYRRGLLIWDRGLEYPAFDAAFREAHGKSTLDEGVDELVAAAELDPGVWRFTRHAAIALEIRGMRRLEQGDRHRAAIDFETAAFFNLRLD